MAQKEIIEFVAKVDDQTNQVVPRNQVGQAVPDPPQVPVDVRTGLQEAIGEGITKGLADAQLEEAVSSSVFREAQLRALRELNESIQAALQGPPIPPIPPDVPTDLSSNFFDPDDNGDIPDLEKLAQQQQDAIDDLINSFDKIDNGSIDPQRFDDATAEFDKEFADMDAVNETMDSLTESLEKPLEVLGILTPELTLFVKGLAIATGAISSLVVATQLYSSVLAATIENFGELSADVKRAQADTELDRIRQQLRFADEFGDVLAEMERNRNVLRDTQRGFLANLSEAAAPWADSLTAGLTAVLASLDALLGWAQPIIEILQYQAGIVENIFKTITWVANKLNPFKWFESDRQVDNSDIWTNLTAPENFLDVGNLRPKNVNGRDVFDMDDLMEKNL